MNSREDDLIRRTAGILKKHVGAASAITAREIADDLGIVEGDTFVRTRAIIDKAIRVHKLPIAANNGKPSGYFYISNEDELSAYMGTLEGRKLQIEDKKQIVFRNYIEQYGPLRETDEE